MSDFTESITYNFEDDKNKEDAKNTFFGNELLDKEDLKQSPKDRNFQEILKNQFKYLKEHPTEKVEGDPIEWFLNKMRPSLFIPTPGPDGKPIECEVRCRGCKNIEDCSYIQHPELLVSRIVDKSTNRYTCYEEKVDE